MKELHGTAGVAVAAPPERCRRLLSDIERYPCWYPEVVRRVEVLERGSDGGARTARTGLHVPNVPLISDIELLLGVDLPTPDSVKLSRIAHGPEDHERFAVTWGLDAAGAGTSIELVLDAYLSVPRLVPVSGIGNRMASGFADAAARALEG